MVGGPAAPLRRGDGCVAHIMSSAPGLGGGRGSRIGCQRNGLAARCAGIGNVGRTRAPEEEEPGTMLRRFAATALVGVPTPPGPVDIPSAWVGETMAANTD